MSFINWGMQIKLNHLNELKIKLKIYLKLSGFLLPQHKDLKKQQFCSFPMSWIATFVFMYMCGLRNQQLEGQCMQQNLTWTNKKYTCLKAWTNHCFKWSHKLTLTQLFTISKKLLIFIYFSITVHSTLFQFNSVSLFCNKCAHIQTNLNVEGFLFSFLYCGYVFL